MKSTLKRTNKGKKRKSRRRYKKRTRRNLFGGVSNIPIVFKFTIIGGQKDDEENWVVYDRSAELLSDTAKNRFRAAATKQLNDIPYITKDNLVFKFETELFVFAALEPVNFEHHIDEIISIVNTKNGNIRQATFKGEPSVESDGLYFKFDEISIPMG
jgi:hypothetical protein